MTSAFAEPEDLMSLERGTVLTPRFDDKGLIPALATDWRTGEVLMLAWMNAEAFRQTIERGEAVYWSRSRGELWHKGATSGHVQVVRELRVDCDQDAVWLVVEQRGAGACHVGYRSCFYRRVTVSENGEPRLEFVDEQPAYDPDAVYGGSSTD